MVSPSRTVGLLVLGILAAGCYSLQPVRGAAPVVGTTVAFDVNDAGRVALGGQIDDHQIPHMVFINKLDTASARVSEVLAALQGVSQRPLVLPCGWWGGAGGAPAGVGARRRPRARAQGYLRRRPLVST